jgi:hypothetical protein
MLRYDDEFEPAPPTRLFCNSIFHDVLLQISFFLDLHFDHLDLIPSLYEKVGSVPAALSFYEIEEPAGLFAHLHNINKIELQKVQIILLQLALIPDCFLLREAWEFPNTLPDTASVCDFSESHKLSSLLPFFSFSL